MKKLLIILTSCFILVSCADNKTINGTTYRPYGFINEKSCKVDSVHYEFCGTAALCGIVFSGFLLIPTVYTFGYNLYEPKCMKKDFKPGQDGIIK